MKKKVPISGAHATGVSWIEFVGETSLRTETDSSWPPTSGWAANTSAAAMENLPSARDDFPILIVVSGFPLKIRRSRLTLTKHGFIARKTRQTPRIEYQHVAGVMRRRPAVSLKRCSNGLQENGEPFCGIGNSSATPFANIGSGRS